MNLYLRAGDKLYLNGAVIRVDRKVSVEILNKVTFLLGTHVLQADEANTPLRQIYFVIQTMVMDPASSKSVLPMVHSMIMSAIEAFDDARILSELKRIDELICNAHHFEAMKVLRSLFDPEKRLMSSERTSASSDAA